MVKIFLKLYFALRLSKDYLRPRRISSFFRGDDKNVSSGSIFMKISSCAFHNAAIDQRGHLYTWGQKSAKVREGG